MQQPAGTTFWSEVSWVSRNWIQEDGGSVPFSVETDFGSFLSLLDVWRVAVAFCYEIPTIGDQLLFDLLIQNTEMDKSPLFPLKGGPRTQSHVILSMVSGQSGTRILLWNQHVHILNPKPLPCC